MESDLDVSKYIENPYSGSHIWSARRTLVVVSVVLWIAFLQGSILDVATGGIGLLVARIISEDGTISMGWALVLVSAFAEWYYFYRRAPPAIKKNLSRSGVRVVLVKLVKMFVFLVLVTVFVTSVMGDGWLAILFQYGIMMAVAVLLLGNYALADLSRVHRKYKRLLKRTRKITEDDDARVTVDIEPSIEEIHPDQYDDIGEALTAVGKYETALKPIEHAYQNWKKVERIESRVRRRFKSVDATAFEPLYQDLKTDLNEYSPDVYTSSRTALTDIQRLEDQVSTYTEASRLKQKGDALLRDTRQAKRQYSGYGFETFVKTMEERLEMTAGDVDDTTQYEQTLLAGRETLDLAVEVAQFLESVGASHPNVDYSRWKRTVRTAVETVSPKDIYQLEADIDRLQNTNWRHDSLYDYTWQEFEELVGLLYQVNGYTVQVTQGSNDGGVDVWAADDGERIAIQVKQYSEGSTVGRPELQRIASTLATGEATQVAVVTSASFSQTAIEYSRQFESRMELIDGKRLVVALSESAIATKR